MFLHKKSAGFRKSLVLYRAMWPEIREFLGSNIVALCGAFIVAALEVKGVIRVAVGRLYLILAWVVATFGAAAALNDAPPTHRLLTIVYVGIPAAIALIALDLWTTSIVKRRASATPELPAGEVATPNIVCSGEDDLHVKLDRHEVFHLAGSGELALRAATVKFCNQSKPPQKVGGIDNVGAQIIYYSLDWPDREDLRIDHVCWLNEESPFVSFSRDQCHQLIVAVLQPKYDSGFENHLILYENSLDRHIPLERHVHQSCNGYWIKVKLIAGKHGEHGGEYDFELRFDANRQSYIFVHMTEEKKRQRQEGLNNHIERFVSEGQKLLSGPPPKTSEEWDRYYSELHGWRNKVYEHLRRHGDWYIAERFNSTSDLQPYSNEIHPDRMKFLSEFYTQLKNLEGMAMERRAGNLPAASELLIGQLGQLLNKGVEIMRRLEGNRVTVPHKQDAEEWAKEVVSVLSDNNMKIQAVRFSNEVITHKYTGTMTQNTRELFHWLHTRITRLDEIIEALIRDKS